MYYPPSFHHPKAQGQCALVTGVLASRELEHTILCSSDALSELIVVNA